MDVLAWTLQRPIYILANIKIIIYENKIAT